MRLAMYLLTASLIGCAGGDDGHDDGDLFEQAYEDAHDEGKIDGFDCSGVRVPDRSGFAKRIALTFDDGPNPETTPKVIEVLKAHHAPATFFNNGIRYGTAGAPQIAAQIAADPDFILANHSQHHLNLAEQSAAKLATEVDQTDALIRTAGETPKYFRFPFGSATCSHKMAVQARGYIVTGWHIDSADWCFATTGGARCPSSTFRYVDDQYRNDMKGFILSQIRAMNGGIILMHDSSEEAELRQRNRTLELTRLLVPALEARGYRFVGLDAVPDVRALMATAPTVR